MSEAPTRSRRSFAKALAAAAGAPLLAPVAAFAQAAPAPSPTPAPTPVPTPEQPSSAAEALTEVVRIRWGKNLSGEELAEIAKTIDGRLRGAERMKSVKLGNGDEPDFVFSALGK
jgi:hypothetical protein